MPDTPASPTSAPRLDLAGSVALVTGAGSGIGRATALRMAAVGARVAACDRDADAARATADAIEAGGGEALALTADVASPDDLARAVAAIDARWGRLDIVHTHAGVNGVWAPVDEITLEEWNATLAVNLTGTFLTIRAALPLLRRTVTGATRARSHEERQQAADSGSQPDPGRGGAIVVTTSVNGTRVFSNSGASAYAASKAGQTALVKMLALELAPDRIRVNAVAPGWIETGVEESKEARHLDRVRIAHEYPEGAVPLTGGAPGNPDRVADVVIFLASAASAHVTGAEIVVDGGESLLEG